MLRIEQNFIPVPKEYVPKEGLHYAVRLAKKTQLASLLFNISGWTLIMLGILLGVAGSVLGTDLDMAGDPGLGKLLAQQGLICNTFAIIIAGVGRQLLERAKASAKLASIATKAIATSSKLTAVDGQTSDSDRNAYDACVLAKAVWLEKRTDDTQLNEIMNKLGQEKAN